jgi:hypothetical protein
VNAPRCVGSGEDRAIIVIGPHSFRSQPERDAAAATDAPPAPGQHPGDEGNEKLLDAALCSGDLLHVR